MLKILIVEDDVNIQKLMQAILEQNNYGSVVATNGHAAFDVMEQMHVDLIVLDAMMPEMNGFEFARDLRSVRDEIPILMVTALEEMDSMRKGFLLGVDDYMTKPINEEEFILRIKALLRRAKIAHDHRIIVGQTVLDHDEFSASAGDEKITLPRKEFLLLFKLLSYPDKIFTRRQLIDEIWSFESETDERTVDVHVNRIRERLKNNIDFELVTVRGLGYKAVILKEGE